MLGRLKPGVDRRQAEGELNLLMQQIIENSRNVDRGPSQITLDPLWRSPFGANVYMYKTLPMLLALAAALLLLACANVANLLLVRSVARRRKLRCAWPWAPAAGGWSANSWWKPAAGAGRRRRLPWCSPPGRPGHLPPSFPRSSLTAHDRMATPIVGVLPGNDGHFDSHRHDLRHPAGAARLPDLAPIAVLKEEAGSISGGIHKSRLSSALVVAQISLSLLLLIWAGLFIRSLQNAQRLDPGFDPNHVLLASYELGPVGYTRAQGIAFHRQLLAKLQSLPGVESVALADFSPLSFTIHSDYVYPEGYVPQPHESMEISRAIVSPNYFRTMRTPLVAGREFTEQDGEKSQSVAIVNQEFVDRYWPGQDAIGKRFSNDGVWFNVVGVARNGKYRRLVYAPEPVIFLPLLQVYRDQVIIHARVSGDPAGLRPGGGKNRPRTQCRFARVRRDDRSSRACGWGASSNGLREPSRAPLDCSPWFSRPWAFTE